MKLRRCLPGILRRARQCFVRAAQWANIFDPISKITACAQVSTKWQPRSVSQSGQALILVRMLGNISCYASMQCKFSLNPCAHEHSALSINSFLNDFPFTFCQLRSLVGIFAPPSEKHFSRFLSAQMNAALELCGNLYMHFLIAPAHRGASNAFARRASRLSRLRIHAILFFASCIGPFLCAPRAASAPLA